MTSTSPENDDPATPRRPASQETGGSAGASVPSRPLPPEPERPGPAQGSPVVTGSGGPARGTTTGKVTVQRVSGSAGSDRGRSSDRGKGSTEKGGDKAKGSDKGNDWSVFRTVVILVGLVLAAFGAYYLILGSDGLPDTEVAVVNPTLESQFRFFSAMMIGVGAAFITIAVKFQWANMLWLVCLMVFIGGIGRVLSWAFSGTPHYTMIILMVVELAFPPALLVWHKYIAKTSDLRREFAERD
ncbi:DUF4345 domain-containing protein [Arthrobacter echini]|uniref:DUF4345 domain-containing protein n=1 Tax=Arthrobacter echini TaxID=1529066 RepID=A0A4V3Z5S4_9MICC|nr:DUF4345 domain-containing protein [Arthrobacter echini]THJ67729.1 DUF4345 domain-containing protein [Arthrobacter echini]